MSHKIQIKNLQFEPYISSEKIQKRIVELSKELELYAGDKQLCFLVVLNGAMFFASDLILNYSKPCELQTIKCKSYEGLSSTGTIKFELPFSESISNKHVVILEDIIDTGTTLDFLWKEIQQFNPASVKVCSLLFKPAALKHPLQLDFIGFEIPNAFVLGYGLDYDGLGRNYKDIYKLV